MGTVIAFPSFRETKETGEPSPPHTQTYLASVVLAAFIADARARINNIICKAKNRNEYIEFNTRAIRTDELASMINATTLFFLARLFLFLKLKNEIRTVVINANPTNLSSIIIPPLLEWSL
jgi:hypothetical protein